MCSSEELIHKTSLHFSSVSLFFSGFRLALHALYIIHLRMKKK